MARSSHRSARRRRRDGFRRDARDEARRDGRVARLASRRRRRRRKKESAVFSNHAKRANDALIRWRKKTDTCRRNRAWCAFAETWRARRALTRTVSALASMRIAPSRRARPSRGRPGEERASDKMHGFPLAQARVHGRCGRRARAAGVREVAVRKDGARVRRLSFFGVREAREAFGVDGVLGDATVGVHPTARWRDAGGPTRAPPLRRRGGGDAKSREQNAFNETYRRVAPRRLPRPRTRPRSRGGASRADARVARGLGRRYRVGDFFDRPTAR